MKNQIKQIIAQGADWYQDRYEAVKVERNRYLLLLVVCLIALIISLLANLFLSPLKTAVPYVIQIDKSTGITTVLQPVNAKSLQQQEAVTTYFLFKYLNARMGYDYALRQRHANIVRALSAASAYRQYAQQMDTVNPESPIRQYKNNKTVSVHIESFSFPYPNMAEIHFYTQVHDDSTLAESSPNRQYWLALIEYTYANVALSLSDREGINPLGFFVTHFQLSQETLRGG